MTTYLLICLQHIIIQGISFLFRVDDYIFLYMFAPFHYTIFLLKADDGIFIDYSQHIIILGIFLHLKMMMTYLLIIRNILLY